MREHRVPVLGTGLRRPEDPETSRDPRVRSVVQTLKTIELADLTPAPAPGFRAELRAQLVAIAPRVVAESTAEAAHEAVPEKTKVAVAQLTKPAPRVKDRRFVLARPVPLAFTVLGCLLLMFGGAVWLSQKAVPGDALYGLKRSSESVRLSLATSDPDRANLLLEFAGTRVDEAHTLVDREVPAGSGAQAAGGLSATTKAQVRAELRSANSDVVSAAKLLGGYAVNSHSRSSLKTLVGWAPAQQHRLTVLWKRMPDGSGLKPSAAHSKLVVQSAAHRAQQIGSDLHRSCLRHSGTDQLGPMPCTKAHRTQQGHGTQTPSRPTTQPTNWQRKNHSIRPKVPAGPPVTGPKSTPTPRQTPQPPTTAPPSSGPTSVPTLPLPPLGSVVSSVGSVLSSAVGGPSGLVDVSGSCAEVGGVLSLGSCSSGS